MSNNISVSMHIGSGKNAINNMDKIKRADLHNNRKYKNNKNEEIDLSLSQYNITLVGTKNIVKDIKDFYKTEFGEALYNYNKKQNREDRKIIDYLEKMNNDTKSNIAVEMIFQIGDKQDWENATMEDKQKTIDIFKKAIPILQEKNIKCFNASVHLDETSPHLHLLAVPVVEKQTRGLEKQVSQNKVITKSVLNDIRTEVEKAFITEYNKIYGTNKELKKGCEIEEHLQVKDYKDTKKVLEVAKKTADKQVLKEKIEKDYKKLADEVKEKEKENNFLTNELTKLVEEKENKKQDLEKIKEDIENIDNIREELNNQSKDIEKLKADKDSNNSIIEMYKNNAVETREKIDNLKKEFNKLEDERLEEAKKNENIKREIEEQNTIRKQQENILKDIENAENLRKERQKKLRELEEENKKLEEKIQEQEIILRKLENRSQENEEKIKKLKEDEDTIMSKISNNSNNSNIEVDITSLLNKIDYYELVKKYKLYDTLPQFQVYNSSGDEIYNSQTGYNRAENYIIDLMGEEYFHNMNFKDIKEWEELYNSQNINITVPNGDDYNNYNGYDDYSKETIEQFLQNNKDITREIEKKYSKNSKGKDEIEEKTTKEIEKDFF